MEGRSAVEVTPPKPLGSHGTISPDGQWIAYRYVEGGTNPVQEGRDERVGAEIEWTRASAGDEFYVWGDL